MLAKSSWLCGSAKASYSSNTSLQLESNATVLFILPSMLTPKSRRPLLCCASNTSPSAQTPLDESGLHDIQRVWGMSCPPLPIVEATLYFEEARFGGHNCRHLPPSAHALHHNRPGLDRGDSLISRCTAIRYRRQAAVPKAQPHFAASHTQVMLMI